ncbi:hypothetical protein SCHPADRAFT_907771 [Schizopora paradoxa]|uniref:Uncharacterized protein n=1 Tax=Schizopora paradoxa TaxID=27342 RepID=A0A0H2RJ52_9AGAM|nr:hypothetical protein SCHPADRAFT_907771 [Schizopora paradoxa]
MASPTVDASDVVHWVQSPPPPPGMKTIPIPGMNQIFNPCNECTVVPGPIDVERFKRAVLSWLTLVPHAAGRLSKDKNGSWTITSSYPIPVTTASYTGVYTEEKLNNIFPEIMDSIPWIYSPPADLENHPLTRFKLTHLTRTNETVIFVSMCHCIVDGIALFNVLHMLSDIYCGANVSDLAPRAVTYENYLGNPPPYLDPSGDAYKRALARTPILEKGYEPDAHLNKWMQSMADTDRVDLFFTKEQMDVLVRRANAKLPAKSGRVTTATVLPAYMFTVLNRVYGKPRFNRVLSVLGVRGMFSPQGSSYEFPSTNSAGMAIVQTVSDPFPQKQLLDISFLATSLRKHTENSLKPETLLDITSVYEQRQLQLANENKIAWMLPEDGDGILGSNLMYRTEVRVHFGYGANRCRFYTWPPIKHYLRAFKANPIQYDDGTWEDREGVIHLMFLVEKGYGNKVYDLVRDELRHFTAQDGESKRPLAKL